MDNQFLDDYNHFVDTLLSKPSKDVSVLLARYLELDGVESVNIARLVTASDGLCSESGELKEIIKKILYQGKPLTADTHFHMLRELGDVAFYWMVACQALGQNPSDVIKENVRKLEARYPGGQFDIGNSEVRQQGDL